MKGSPRPPRVHRSINSCSRSIPESSGELPPPAPRDTVLPRFLSGVWGSQFPSNRAFSQAWPWDELEACEENISLWKPSISRWSCVCQEATQAAEAEKEREMGSEREKERERGWRRRGRERERDMAWVQGTILTLTPPLDLDRSLWGHGGIKEGCHACRQTKSRLPARELPGRRGSREFAFLSGRCPCPPTGLCNPFSQWRGLRPETRKPMPCESEL